MAKDKRCRHNGAWVISGGWAMWCYECGAYRSMAKAGFGNTIYPASKWQKPVGLGGENPWDGFSKSKEKYHTRYAEFL